MTTYDPFERGRFPVGVRSDSWEGLDAGPLAVEIWYPATDDHRGEDLDPGTTDRFPAVWAPDNTIADEMTGQAAVRDATPRAQRCPLILLPHGLAGFRREATFVGTHLASHGYVVVAADHRHSTFAEVDAYLQEDEPSGRPREVRDLSRTIAEARIVEIPFLIEQAYARLSVDEAAGAGITGASFGGWTSLMGPALDDRIRSTVPMCPAGGRSPIPRAPGDPVGTPLREHLDAGWPGGVRPLMIVADHDSWLPLYGTIELFGKLPAPARMVILKNANHNHFVDDIEVGHEWMRSFTAGLAERFPEDRWGCIAADIDPYDQMMPAEHAYLACRGLTVAHFDATLKQAPDAIAFWERDLRAVMADQGVDVELIERLA